MKQKGVASLCACRGTPFKQDLPHLSTMCPREDIKNCGVHLRIAPAGADASKPDHK